MTCAMILTSLELLSLGSTTGKLWHGLTCMSRHGIGKACWMLPSDGQQECVCV